ncbi:FeoC-like transcriptional regulator [Musicola keenii]|uniref:FeoC-like transcriptional regulator n=1 Tax=Musicola keenii TaxID=2884250 RepID=UPI00177E86AF|nr:FeoC-like transcriptional regulator [Musicola keenii]
MTLMELRDFVRERKKVSLRDISVAFHAEPGVIEGMLDVWVQKGKIRCHREKIGSQCGSCCSCDKSLGQFYEWL